MLYNDPGQDATDTILDAFLKSTLTDVMSPEVWTRYEPVLDRFIATVAQADDDAVNAMVKDFLAFGVQRSGKPVPRDAVPPSERVLGKLHQALSDLVAMRAKRPPRLLPRFYLDDYPAVAYCFSCGAEEPPPRGEPEMNANARRAR